MNGLLLACDLDRTVIPNGTDPVSDNAVSSFNDFVEKPNVTLAYLSGRNLNEIVSVLSEYGIATPKIIVGNDGTSIYIKENNNWEIEYDWGKKLIPQWKVGNNMDIHEIIKDIPGLILQETQHQDKFKLSYYAPEEIDNSGVLDSINRRLEKRGMKTVVITSVDHIGHKAYLDILPQSGTKGHALEYLINKYNFKKNNVVVCGDSGNDLILLTQGYWSIVVKNATKLFKNKVRNVAVKDHILNKIYFAEGGYKGMNGNYVSGIMEGLNHFGFIDQKCY